MPKPTLPVAPTNLVATPISVSQVQLTWSDNANNETDFRVERNGVEIATVGANVTAFADTGLQPQTTYSYRVRAHNAKGFSAYSNTAQATTFAPPPPPPPPTLFLDEEYGTMINVKNAPYNAAGDGITDDRAAIQAAIDAAQNLGCRVFFPAGVYAVGDQLWVKQAIHLIGEGPLATAIKALPSFAFPNIDTAILHQQTVNGVASLLGENHMGRIHLKNLKVDGANVASANGILASCQQQAIWENVRVDNCPGYGMAFSEGQQLVLRNIELIHNRIGFWNKGHSFLWVYDLNIEQSTEADVRVESGVTGLAAMACSFTNVHFETQGPIHCFDILSGAYNTIFTNVFASVAPGGTIFYFGPAVNSEEQGWVYTIVGAHANGAMDQITMLDDRARNITLNAFYDCRRFLQVFVSPNENPYSPPWIQKNGLQVLEVAGLRKL
jgi:hypothetical protein